MDEATSGLDELHQVYDAAMRMWAEISPAEAAQWLDPSLKALPEGEFQQLPARLVVPAIEADFLLRAGPDRLLHVEFESSPDENLIQRLFEYRGRMMRLYPGFRLTQYVIVLGSGNVIGYDDLEKFGFAMDVRVIYLREFDPAEFLTSVLLAPLAVLARGSGQPSEQSLEAAIRLLRDSPDPRARLQLQVLDGLAGLVLDRSVVEQIEKENGMNYEPLVKFYLGTEVGQRLKALGRDEGLVRGALAGQEQGREQGREELLLALLQARFGDLPAVTAAAQRLAHWDEKAAVAAVTAATDPQQLLTSVLSTSSGQ